MARKTSRNPPKGRPPKSPLPAKPPAAGAAPRPRSPRDVVVIPRESLVAGGTPAGFPRRMLEEAAAGKLRPIETVGKVRLRLRSAEGEAAGLVAFRLLVRTAADAEPAVVARGSTDAAGYASVDLSSVQRARVTDLEVEIEAPGQAALRLPIGRAHFATHRDGGIPHEIILPSALATAARRVTGGGVARLAEPDASDLANSPESFSFATEQVDGSCCLKPNPELASRQFFFTQLVRLDAPQLAGQSPAAPRAEIRAPIAFGDESPETYAAQAAEPVTGKLNVYRHAWFPAARGLGELLYSLPLAPCERVNLVIIDWSREEADSRREELSSSERLAHETHRDRTIEESVASVLHEEQAGWSAALGAGVSISLPKFSLGGGGGGAGSGSTGLRELQASTVQQIADAVTQQSSVLRSQRATVITTSSQRESERIQTRAVHNHNRNHALTIQYFQVLSHYRVRTELVEEQPVVLVPYAIERELFEPLPAFEKFRREAIPPLLSLIDRHQQVWRPLTPRAHLAGYEALNRLLHHPEVYRGDEPWASGSHWELSLSQAARPGLTLELETSDGQCVELRPRLRERAAAGGEWVSAPVDLATLRRLRLSFDPAAALRQAREDLAGLRGERLEAALAEISTLVVAHCELHVRTDVSRFLDRPQTHRVPVQVKPVTLSAAHPSAVLQLSPPKISFARYQGQQRRDYGLVRALVACLQSAPLRFLRATWLEEDRDRRALRLDRFLFAGRPLLDQIENRAVGVCGNLVAFPLLEGHRFVPASKPGLVFSERLVSLPTPGVFAEVYLSCCNATELRDVTRALDPGSSCTLDAPEIAPVAAGSRRDRADTTPSGFAAPIVNIQSPAALPDPTGLGPALTAVTTANAFRDMSLGSNLLSFIGAATSGAQQSTREAQQQRAELLAQIAAAQLGVPLPAGSDSKASGSTAAGGFPGLSAGAGGSAGQPSLRAPATGGGGSSTPSGLPGLQVAHTNLARQTPAPQLVDHVSAIRNAAASGLLTPSQAQAATNALLGGPLPQTGQLLPEASATAAAGVALAEPAGRPCCALGADIVGVMPVTGVEVAIPNVQDRTTLKPHVYGEASDFRGDGLIYACRGGLLDTGHIRDCADYTAYFAVQAAALLGTGGTVKLRGGDFGSKARRVTFFAQNATPPVELCILLGMRISYELAIWHEIQTWFHATPVSRTDFPDRYSAFSPEDNYSNLLGTYVAAEALLDPRPYDEALTAALDRNLAALGARSVAETRAALATVKDRWWDSSKKLPDKDFLLRRHLEPFGTVTPWPLTCPSCFGLSLLSLDVPEVFPPDGSALASYYELEIEPDLAVIPASVLPPPPRTTTITPADFPDLVTQVLAQVLTAFGPDADKP